MALGLLNKLTNYLMPMDEDGEHAATEPQPATSHRLLHQERDKKGKVVNLRVHSNDGVPLKVMVLEPKAYDDVLISADCLKANMAVVLHFQSVDVPTQHSIIDFMNGVCYVTGGEVMRISPEVLFYTPAYVGIEKELYSYTVPDCLRKAVQ